MPLPSNSTLVSDSNSALVSDSNSTLVSDSNSTLKLTSVSNSTSKVTSEPEVFHVTVFGCRVNPVKYQHAKLIPINAHFYSPDQTIEFLKSSVYNFAKISVEHHEDESKSFVSYWFRYPFNPEELYLKKLLQDDTEFLYTIY